MKVTFYGVRGSIAVPDKDMVKYGGNTSCLHVLTDNGTNIIFDAGTGVRNLGDHLNKVYKDKPINLSLFLSHTHWDHIQGFPFFFPIFDSKNIITIYGRSRYSKSVEEIIAGQMEHKYWPVSLGDLSSAIAFTGIEEGTIELADGVKVTAMNHYHPGGAFGYRVEADGKSFVYSTDTEHVGGVIDERVVNLAENADVLVHDAQYDDEEMKTHGGWGHSSFREACEVAERAKVKSLYLFHLDPYCTDSEAEKRLKKARKLFKNTNLSKESLVVAL